jgi:rhodanese-related sulfurtransferase
MPRISRRLLIGGGVTAVALAGVGGYVAHTLRQTAADTALTPPDAHAAARDGRILLVDIRRPDEWRKTGIPEGAVPIDLRRDDFTDAVSASRAFPDQPVAVICARGVRSRRMTVRLDEAGITPIIDVPEGMLGSGAGPGWLERGLPVRSWNG